jgi:hypothetical protein
VKEYLAHPDRLKRLETGRALLIKGTSECSIIEVDYSPVEPRSAFAPTAGTRPRAGRSARSRPVLDLTALVEAQRAKVRGAAAKRKAAAPSKAKADETRTDTGANNAHGGPVKRRRPTATNGKGAER